MPPLTPDDERTRQLVCMLYRGVLKREPDAAGLAYFTQQLGADPSFDHALALLRTFVGSAENQGQGQGRAAAASGLPAPMDAPVSHIASIGQLCAASFMLKQLGLKRWSGPFDWIFCNLALVLDCLEDDFAALLDRGCYQPVPLDAREHPTLNLCHHALFRERYGIAHLFNHFDPSEEAGYAYLQRCVDRFRRMLAAPGRKLLFGLYHPDTTDRDAFLKLAALLDRRWPGTEILVVEYQPPVHPFDAGFRLRECAGPHAIVEMRPLSALDGLAFAAREDVDALGRMLEGLGLALEPQASVS